MSNGFRGKAEHQGADVGLARFIEISTEAGLLSYRAAALRFPEEVEEWMRSRPTVKLAPLDEDEAA